MTVPGIACELTFSYHFDVDGITRLSTQEFTVYIDVPSINRGVDILGEIIPELALRGIADYKHQSDPELHKMIGYSPNLIIDEIKNKIRSAKFLKKYDFVPEEDEE